MKKNRVLLKKKKQAGSDLVFWKGLLDDERLKLILERSIGIGLGIK